jgi:acetolactate synthase-1/2/3 large subunit
MGAFDEMSDLSLHMLGMHGSVYANLAMQHADLIMSIGARFDDRVTGNLTHFAPEARRAESEGRGGIVHVDILSKNIAKVVTPTIGLVSDAGEALRAMLPLCHRQEHSEWLSQLHAWKSTYPFSYDVCESDKEPLKSQEVLACLNELLGDAMAQDRVIITTGVGQHQVCLVSF